MQVDRANGQAQGLATMLNDALASAERLASENRELRRKQEDAVIDTCVLAPGHAVSTCILCHQLAPHHQWSEC